MYLYGFSFFGFDETSLNKLNQNIVEKEQKMLYARKNKELQDSNQDLTQWQHEQIENSVRHKNRMWPWVVQKPGYWAIMLILLSLEFAKFDTLKSQELLLVKHPYYRYDA